MPRCLPKYRSRAHFRLRCPGNHNRSIHRQISDRDMEWCTSWTDPATSSPLRAARMKNGNARFPFSIIIPVTSHKSQVTVTASSYCIRYRVHYGVLPCMKHQTWHWHGHGHGHWHSINAVLCFATLLHHDRVDRVSRATWIQRLLPLGAMPFFSSSSTFHISHFTLHVLPEKGCISARDRVSCSRKSSPPCECDSSKADSSFNALVAWEHLELWERREEGVGATPVKDVKDSQVAKHVIITASHMTGEIARFLEQSRAHAYSVIVSLPNSPLLLHPSVSEKASFSERHQQSWFWIMVQG